MRCQAVARPAPKALPQPRSKNEIYRRGAETRSSREDDAGKQEATETLQVSLATQMVASLRLCVSAVKPSFWVAAA